MLIFCIAMAAVMIAVPLWLIERHLDDVATAARGQRKLRWWK